MSTQADDGGAREGEPDRDTQVRRENAQIVYWLSTRYGNIDMDTPKDTGEKE